MKKYYLRFKFKNAIYSLINKDLMTNYSIVGDTGVILEDMYKYASDFANEEHLQLSGKKKGKVFRNSVEVGQFSIDSVNID